MDLTGLYISAVIREGMPERRRCLVLFSLVARSTHGAYGVTKCAGNNLIN